MFIEKKDIDESLGLLSETILEKVLDDGYGFDDSWVILPFININGQGIPINRRSETAKKAFLLYQGNLFILKEIPWYCSNIPFIEYELLFQQLLSSFNKPVPKIHKTKQGDFFYKVTKKNQEKFFFLQDFVIGNSWDHSVRKLINASFALSDLHKTSKEIMPKLIGVPPSGNVFELAIKMIDVLDKVIDEKSLFIKNSDSNLLIELSKKFRKAIYIEKEKAELKGYNNLVIPIHGDFNPWNIIYDDNEEVIGIIDFDNSLLDNPSHDVAEALLDFCFFEFREQRTRFSKLPININNNLAKIFLKGYFSNVIDDFRVIKQYLPEVTVAVAIELFVLGVVRGDFVFEDLPKFGSIYPNINKMVFSILETL